MPKQKSDINVSNMINSSTRLDVIQSENTENVADEDLMAKQEDKIDGLVEPEDSDSDRKISADGSLTEDLLRTQMRHLCLKVGLYILVLQR